MRTKQNILQCCSIEILTFGTIFFFLSLLHILSLSEFPTMYFSYSPLLSDNLDFDICNLVLESRIREKHTNSIGLYFNLCPLDLQFVNPTPTKSKHFVIFILGCIGD